MMLITGFPGTLILAQMIVIGPSRGGDMPSYARSMLSAQTLVFLPIIVVLGLLGLAFSWAGIVAGITPRLIVIVCVNAAALMTLEFMKSMLFLTVRTGLVFLLDGLIAFLWVGATLVAWQMGAHSLVEFTLETYGVVVAAAAVLGFFLIKFPRPQPLTASLVALSEAWGQGRWAVGGWIVGWLQNQSYVWVLAALASTAAVAEANFARLFLAPLPLMLGAVRRVIVPHLSRMKETQAPRAVIREGRRVLFALMVVIVVYCIAIAWLHTSILSIFGKSDYHSTGVLIVAWSVTVVAQAVRTNGDQILLIFRKNHQLTAAISVAAVTAVGSSLVLIPLYGAAGGVASVAVGEILLALIMSVLVSRLGNAESSADVVLSARQIEKA
jgi:O-antigen/teichoic acid export membrane protein